MGRHRVIAATILSQVTTFIWFTVSAASLHLTTNLILRTHSPCQGHMILFTEFVSMMMSK